MPVDRSQPVYPPSKGEDILATWGDQVSEHVVQRFATAAERDAKWANPPKGAMCVTVDTLTLWMYDGTNWINPHAPKVTSWSAEFAGPSANRTHDSIFLEIPNIPLINGHRFVVWASGAFLDGSRIAGREIGYVSGFWQAGVMGRVPTGSAIGSSHAGSEYINLSHVGEWIPNFTGTRTAALWAYGPTSGAAFVFAGARITVADMGPA